MALRSMFGENMPMNEMHPRFHLKKMGKAPDVIIYNTDEAAGFPNGRLLTDDVVDLVGDMRVLGNDDPFPATNDVPFLADFPYLAPPQ
jgi:predicted Rdx family selenoprotein